MSDKTFTCADCGAVVDDDDDEIVSALNEALALFSDEAKDASKLIAICDRCFHKMLDQHKHLRVRYERHHRLQQVKPWLN
jgi:5-methylcytosine-specific restriction endonuclease McrA